MPFVMPPLGTQIVLLFLLAIRWHVFRGPSHTKSYFESHASFVSIEAATANGSTSANCSLC